MDLSSPAASILRELDAAALAALSHTTAPLTTADIRRIAGRGTHRGLTLALTRLGTQGIITPHTVGRMFTYTANRDHLLWPAIEALLRAADTVLEDLWEDLRSLASSTLSAETSLAVYGSAARGEATELSDIDLLMIVPTASDEARIDEAIEHIDAQIVRLTGNRTHVYRLATEDLPYKIAHKDPIIDSWNRDARTLHGPDVKILLQEALRRSNRGRGDLDGQ